MNSDKEILVDLVRSGSLILEFCEGLDYPRFAADQKTQSSVLYQIVVIGEAINRLSPEFIQAHPELPVSAIRGMRNRVVHEYREVDVKILWEVVQTSIPQLLQLMLRGSQVESD
jgi:uncharacterized protein with HEPN domain